ncbi:MAG: Smr/MutS family protein [Candidatus Magasanikbacteria bacterium]|nr:Smr/MutS family protein [Candidatus Magasanikbacteria bacterium]
MRKETGNPFQVARARHEAAEKTKRQAALAGVQEPSRPELAICAAELGGDVPEIDLHGLSVTQAKEKFEQFFDNQTMLGAEVIRIKHGKGTGVLRQAVRRWLEEKQRNGLIDYFRATEVPGQEQAIIYAVLPD